MNKLLGIAIVTIAGGCTRWGTLPNYGPRHEVGRTLVGAPQIEEVTSSNVSAGFAGGSVSDRQGTTFAMGGLEGGAASVTRTHCVQQAQIDYVQPVTFETRQENRVADVAGSIMLGVAGLSVIAIASAKYNGDLSFYNMDPEFFPKPDTPTAAYTIGGAALIGAGAWLVYSLTSLPKGPPPVMAPQERRWTETTYVEAQGCGLVPADR